MKQVLKVFTAVIIAASFLFGIVACGGQTSTDSIAPIESLVVKGEVTLDTLGLANGESPAAVSFISKFNEKYPDVNVKLNVISSGYDKNSLISSGQIGDVFWLADEEVYTYAVTNQACAELDFYLNQFNVDTSNVYSGMFNTGRVNGKVYMIARDHNHEALIYNRDALKNDNLADPKPDWTWNEFKTYCKQLTKTPDGGTTYTQVGASFDVSYQPVWMAFAEGWGGTLYDTVNKKINLISDTKVYDGLNEMFMLMKDGYMKQIGSAAKYPNFVNGINAVFTNLVYPAIETQANLYEQNGVDWDFANLPVLPHPSVGTGASGHAVYRDSQNLLAAAALCTFFYTDAGQMAYNGNLGGSVPLVKSLADEEFWRAPYDKNYDVFVSSPADDIIGQLACVVPKPVSDILNITVMTKILTEALNGTTSLADGLKNAETRANEKWLAIART